MRKLLTIISFECRVTLRRASFVIVSFVVPLVVLLVFFGARVVRRDTVGRNQAEEAPQEPVLETVGLVDRSGLVRQMPPDLPAGLVVPYSQEGQARRALEAGEIQAYYVIPQDYLASGEFTCVRASYNPFGASTQVWVMRWVLLFNLADGDLEIASRAWIPLNLKVTDLSIQEQAGPGTDAICPAPGFACESSAVLRYLPMIFLVIFFLSILMGSSQLLHGMGIEKEHRVTEVLLLSLSPRQMLVGKVIALGFLGLLQTAAWLGSAYLILNSSDPLLNLSPGFSIPASYLAWGGIFFLLGYSVYAPLMAGAGVLIPDAKSYSGTSMTIAGPIYLAYMATLFLGYEPHGWLATGLSLFPLTSPVVIMWRLIQGGVPSWQPFLAAALLAATAAWIVNAVARLFRAQELLVGQSFSLRRFLRALRSGSS